MGGGLALLGAPRWQQFSQRWARRQPMPSVRQLLSWMDASPAGWILLDRGGRMRHITPKSERILDLNTGRMLVGRSFEDLCNAPNLIGSIAVARRQDRPQRLAWRCGSEDLDVLVVPGTMRSEDRPAEAARALGAAVVVHSGAVSHARELLARLPDRDRSVLVTAEGAAWVEIGVDGAVRSGRLAPR